MYSDNQTTQQSLIEIPPLSAFHSLRISIPRSSTLIPSATDLGEDHIAPALSTPAGGVFMARLKVDSRFRVPELFFWRSRDSRELTLAPSLPELKRQ